MCSYVCVGGHVFTCLSPLAHDLVGSLVRQRRLHVFYFQSLCAFELRHLSIDEEESEPLACGWQKFYTLCEALVGVPDIMEPSIMIKVAAQLRQDELSIFSPNPSSTNFST